MKTYPYIGYWEATELTVLFVANREGLEIEEDENYSCEWSEHEYKNITHEYLQNTYGEVVSPEHAGFIIELCRNNGIQTIYSSSASNARSFEIGDRNINLYSFGIDELSLYRKKLITIPLPPKQTQTATPEEEFEMTQIVKNNGDNLILGCEDSKCDEWPQAGDVVEFKPNPSIDQWVKATIEYQGDKFTILKSDNGREFSKRNSKLKIRKPKTPEEELRDEIKQEIFSSFAIMPELLAKRDVVIGISECVANNIVEYITKKPQ